MADNKPTGGGASGPPSDLNSSKRRRRKPPEQMLRHELSVYQAELETQNEELRRTQVALEASRARYEDLYARAPVGLVTVGLQNKILSINDRAAHILRLSSGSGRRFVEFTTPDSLVAYERHRARIFKNKEDALFELQMRREGGSLFWAEILMNLAREEMDGSLVCQIALTDVSERKRMRDEVAQLAAIVESADQAIMSHDIDGVITTWNAGAQRLFGYSAFEAIGQSIEMLIP